MLTQHTKEIIRRAISSLPTVAHIRANKFSTNRSSTVNLLDGDGMVDGEGGGGGGVGCC